jgi:hypothetical protein
MKKLLHLYNIGHNPFPTLGRGGLGYHPNNSGLGYHLPQFRQTIHGDGLEFIGDELIFVPDKNMTVDELINANANLRESTKEANARVPQYSNENRDTEGFEFIDTPENERRNELEAQKAEADIILNAEGIDTDEYEIDLDKVRRNEKRFLKDVLGYKQVVPKPDKSVPTSAEDKMKIRNYLSSRYTTFKDNKIDKILSDLIKKYPTLTYKLFMSDPDPYLQGTAKIIKEEKKAIAKIKKEVKEEHAKGETETKGHAFENVMISNHQPELKEITRSTTDFKLENVNPLFYNNEDLNDPILVMFRGELTPLADLSLYDASSDKACIDFKNYKTNEIPIQYSKIVGSPSFTPLFTETSKGLKLFNVVCENVGEYVNDYDNTNVLIFAKTNDKIGSWSINNFIKKHINEDEKKYANETRIYFTPSETFVDRMIKEGYLHKSNSHESGKWFKIHIDDMNEHKMR